MNHGGRRRTTAAMVPHSRLQYAETLANGLWNNNQSHPVIRCMLYQVKEFVIRRRPLCHMEKVGVVDVKHCCQMKAFLVHAPTNVTP